MPSLRRWHPMGIFDGRFGDKRRSAALEWLSEAMVSQSSVVVRQLGEDRAGEMSAHRVLSAEQVSSGGIAACFAERTASAVSGRRVVGGEDTTQGEFSGRSRKSLGPAG